MNQAPSQDSRPGSTSVSVLTLNLGLLCLELAGRWRIPIDLHLDARLAAAPRLLSSIDADVVALQEIYRRADREFLTEALSERYPYSARPPQTWSPVGSGLLLLSRFPVLQTAFLPSSRLPHWRALGRQQGVLVADIELPAFGRTRFVNVHISASMPFGPVASALSPANLRRDIDHLLAVAKTGGPGVVLAGDFNASPEVNSDEYARILRAGYVDTFVAANPEPAAQGAITWDRDNPNNAHGRFGNAPSQRIDHVFISAASPLQARSGNVLLQEAVVPGSLGQPVPLSDHYGLLVTLAERRRTSR
ncbi:MAG: endonuclease/exonuclease/phosphatase family protein [Xanthobacteraceae bacterium]